MTTGQDLAAGVLSTTLGDQVSRSDSLNSAAGVLAGLAGVITTLAGMASVTTEHDLGLAGLATAAGSAVASVVALIWPRAGREQRPIDQLVDLLRAEPVDIGQDVLTTLALAAVAKNQWRLRGKTASVVVAAILLATAIAIFAATIMVYGKT